MWRGSGSILWKKNENENTATYNIIQSKLDTCIIQSWHLSSSSSYTRHIAAIHIFSDSVTCYFTLRSLRIFFLHLLINLLNLPGLLDLNHIISEHLLTPVTWWKIFHGRQTLIMFFLLGLLWSSSSHRQEKSLRKRD